MKNLRAKNRFMTFLFFLVATAGFTAIVMGLWNAILPEITGVKTITFFQAFGILLLSKILFGGFGARRPWARGQHWKEGMKQKWAMMSPEEQLKLKSEWERRCGKWKTREHSKADSATFQAENEKKYTDQ